MRAMAGLLLAGLLGPLGACMDSGQQDVHEWMVQQRSRVPVRPAERVTIRPYQPEPYQGAGGIDPFGAASAPMVAGQSGRRSASADALLVQERARAREMLESYPLEAMTLVGTMAQEGQVVALVRVEGLIHAVRVGHHLGQNYGRVQHISEAGLTLREVVQDPAGAWVSRPVTLHMGEKSK
ncbi:MAG: pilus assembly protein PilP [Rhodoferax sp.]|nr:pilus assembly protein PilP [Rhodoferax sp.]